MYDPPPSGRGYIQFAFLRGHAVTGAELSQVRPDLRRQNDLPGQATGARRARVALHTHMDATQIAAEGGNILQFAVTPSQEERVSAAPADAPFRQAVVSTRADALKRMEGVSRTFNAWRAINRWASYGAQLPVFGLRHLNGRESPRLDMMNSMRLTRTFKSGAAALGGGRAN